MYPHALQPFLNGSRIYDSSCSPHARVYYIEKENGFFLKQAQHGCLAHEASMTHYFYKLGLAPEVMLYESDENDWLLT